MSVQLNNHSKVNTLRRWSILLAKFVDQAKWSL